VKIGKKIRREGRKNGSKEEDKITLEGRDKKIAGR